MDGWVVDDGYYTIMKRALRIIEVPFLDNKEDEEEDSRSEMLNG